MILVILTLISTRTCNQGQEEEVPDLERTGVVALPGTKKVDAIMILIMDILVPFTVKLVDWRSLSLMGKDCSFFHLDFLFKEEEADQCFRVVIWRLGPGLTQLGRFSFLEVAIVFMIMIMITQSPRGVEQMERKTEVGWMARSRRGSDLAFLQP